MDRGLAALADSASNGALPKLETLRLDRNEMSDIGISALAEAVSKGGLAYLKELHVDDQDMDKENPQAQGSMPGSWDFCPVVSIFASETPCGIGCSEPRLVSVGSTAGYPGSTPSPLVSVTRRIGEGFRV